MGLGVDSAEEPGRCLQHRPQTFLRSTNFDRIIRHLRLPVYP